MRIHIWLNCAAALVRTIAERSTTMNGNDVKNKTAAEQFEMYYTQNITREGAAELLDWLKTTDFFKAPASTRYHGAYENGLCEHSVTVL